MSRLLSITMRLKFCAAHRLIHHPGKCSALHGHNYVVDVTVQMTNPKLDESGMVIDFARVKEIIGGWIDKNWDHNTILNQNDPMLWSPLAGGNAVAIDGIELTRRYGRVPFTMQVEPTAENMALFLHAFPWFDCHPPIRHRAKVTRVTVFETDTCSATSEDSSAD